MSRREGYCCVKGCDQLGLWLRPCRVRDGGGKVPLFLRYCSDHFEQAHQLLGRLADRRKEISGQLRTGNPDWRKQAERR